MRICFFLIVLFGFGCKSTPKKDTVPSVVIVNPELSEFTNRFVEYLKSKNYKEKNVTISTEVVGDTVAILIINSSPTNNSSDIYGMSNLKGYNIYMSGVRLETFFRIEVTKDYPLDRAILKKPIDDLSNIRYSDPLTWYLYFVNDSLTNYWAEEIGRTKPPQAAPGMSSTPKLLDRKILLRGVWEGKSGTTNAVFAGVCCRM